MIHTEQTVQHYVQTMLHSSTDLFFGIFKNDVLCGTTRLHDICADKKSLWQGVLVFLPYQSKGLGFQLVNAASNFALMELEIAKISAGILKNNATSKHIFHKAGFNHVDNDLAYHERQIWVKSSVQKIIQ